MQRNIGAPGRAARGGLAIVFVLIAGCLVWAAPILAAIFGVIGLFSAFEAFVGWCAVRACGIKTWF